MILPRDLDQKHPRRTKDKVVDQEVVRSPRGLGRGPGLPLPGPDRVPTLVQAKKVPRIQKLLKKMKNLIRMGTVLKSPVKRIVARQRAEANQRLLGAEASREKEVLVKVKVVEAVQTVEAVPEAEVLLKMVVADHGRAAVDPGVPGIQGVVIVMDRRNEGPGVLVNPRRGELGLEVLVQC